jgi:tRNA A37 N6-isopentenylltransferase MiaA
MTKVTFTPAATFSISNRSGSVVTVDTTSMNAETIAQIFEYGLTQKVNDAASGALLAAMVEAIGDEAHDAEPEARKAWGKENPEAVVSMRETLRTECAEALAKNIWGVTRATGRTVNPLDSYRVAIVLDLIKAKPDSPVAKEYAAIDSSDQKARYEYRLAWAAAQSDVIDPIAEERMEADRAASKALASLTI